MSANKLQWFFDFVDRISAPAKVAAKNIAGFTKGLRAARTELTDSDRALGRFRDTLGKLREANGKFVAGQGGGADGSGLLANMSRAAIVAGAVASAARMIASGFADAATAAGRFTVREAVFHEGTMTSLRATLHNAAGGGQAAAQGEFRRSLQLASLLPGDNNEFVASRRALATMFQDNSERDAVFALQEDLAQLNPESSGQIRTALTNVLGQIRGQDRVLGNDLIQLQTAGLARVEIFDAIARLRNLQGTEASKRSQARAALSSGQVHGDEAIRAMIDAVQARTGQRIGGFAMAQGNSLAGLMSNIESAPSTLMQNLLLNRGGIQGVAGLQAFSAALREVNSLLDASSPRGQRLMAVMAGMVDGVFGALFKSGDGTSAMDATLTLLEQAVPFVTGLAADIRTLLAPAFGVVAAMMSPVMLALTNASADGSFQQWLADTGRVLGFVAGLLVYLAVAFGLGVVAVVGFVGKLTRATEALGSGIVAGLAGAWEAVKAFFASFGADALFLGRSIVEGIALGISSAAGLVYDAVSGVGNGVVARARAVLGIHSPSQVMAELGAYTAQGFALGIEGGARGVGGAVDAMLGGVGSPGALGAAQGASAGAGGASGASVGELHIHIEAPPGADSAALAATFERLAPSALANALRQLAQERGVG